MKVCKYCHKPLGECSHVAPALQDGDSSFAGLNRTPQRVFCPTCRVTVAELALIDGSKCPRCGVTIIREVS